ncbi:MAG: nucleotidyltransferase domain-containing protein [Oscillospiraceae bacterium]|nr:nucleotidyltransferase domain-containing protein [Oscillospiraceae bacterium]
MRIINSLDELTIPDIHKKFIEGYLKNIRKFDCLSKIYLFGSCAKENATLNSDVDLFVLTKHKVPIDLEFNIIFDSLPTLGEGYVKNDILLKSEEEYEQFKNVIGMIQKAVEQEGVDLSGILQIG